MANNNESHDLDFDLTRYLMEPFRGKLRFTVQKKIRIISFEFSTHDQGCRRTNVPKVKYGLKLKLNGRLIFTYHRNSVDAVVNKTLILTPGNTYELESWLGGHKAPKPGESAKSCYYYYAEVARSDQLPYEPFEFVFSDKDEELSNATCIYVITYEIVD